MTALLRTALTGLLLASVPTTAALAYDPAASSSGSYLAGRSAAKLRDNDIASNYLSSALDADSGNPVLTEKIFLLELSEGNMPKAEEFATEVLKFNSQQRMARIVLGVKDLHGRHYAEARKNFEQSAYTPVGELTSWLLIAWSYAGEGELNPALKTLDRLAVRREGEMVLIEAEARSFLHHQIRNFAGTLYEVGLGRRPVTWPRAVLDGRDRKQAGQTAPPQGLTFMQVDYAEPINWA